MTLMRHRNLARSLTFAAGLLAAALLVGLSGCAMCCAPYDCDFGYQGGAWVRDNPSWGRVGSIFEPAGYKNLADGPSTEPTPAGQEPPAIENLNPEETMPENAVPMPRTAPGETPPNMISAPRMRPVRNYLPEN